MTTVDRKAPVRLAEAIRRSRAINLKLVDIIERGRIAEASPSTIYRWAQGSVDPRLSIYESVMLAVERTIAAEELKLRVLIAPREDEPRPA